jgi:hypothetical protein
VWPNAPDCGEIRSLCSPAASFINRQTLAREILCFFATHVSDMPSRTTCGGRCPVGVRPIWRPSSRARRIPALTRSTMRFLSNSAIAPTMTTMARPSGTAGIDIFPQADEFDPKVTSARPAPPRSGVRYGPFGRTPPRARASNRCRRASASNWSSPDALISHPKLHRCIRARFHNRVALAISRRS